MREIGKNETDWNFWNLNLDLNLKKYNLEKEKYLEFLDVLRKNGSGCLCRKNIFSFCV